jgi:transglutaminase-like putative cysteine protease
VSTDRSMKAPGAVLAVELSLLTLTIASMVGLGRLFDSTSSLPTVGLCAVGGHLLAAVLRRRRAPAAATFVLGALAFGVLYSLLEAPSTTLAGIPTPDTARLIGQQLADAWQVFGATVAPAPVLPGFVFACSAAVWFTAFASDTAALRASAPVEAVVPGTALFIFGAALGAGSHRELTTAFFMVGLLASWASQRWLREATTRTWLGEGSTGRGGRSVLRASAAVVGLCVLLAVTVGPHLPGAQAKALLPWRKTDREGDRSRVVVSPLVDIKSRIVDQAPIEVFTVRTDTSSYWRLTSLETFDGQTWSSNRQYGSAKGRLDPGVQEGTGITAQQHFTISGLASTWLPAAFRPAQVKGADARFDPDSASLLAEDETKQGQEYDVVSTIPQLDPVELAAAPAQAPTDIVDMYTQLPAGFSRRVAREAQRVVAGAHNEYEMARALQDYFRGGNFTYDLSVKPGHSISAIEQFLFETRAGYCEQFAGAYAAMARAVGIPARVAVGFTPGTPIDGGFMVRGLNGHAWPELYFDGIGWVAFEPTPGRGIPNATEYTGAQEQQASVTDPEVAVTAPPTTTTTTPSSTTTPTTLPDERSSSHTGLGRWVVTTLKVLLVVLGLPGAWIGALAWWRRRRRDLRRRSASTPSEQVLVSWDEVAEALRRLGVERRAAETATEYAQRVNRERPEIDGALLRTLARSSTAADFGPGLAQPTADEAALAAAAVERTVETQVSAGARVRELLDPRPLLPKRPPRVVVVERG